MAITSLEERLIYESNLSDRLTPVSWSEDDLYYCVGDDENTAYLGFCFIGDPLAGTSEATRQKLGALYNMGFPVGTFIHMMLFGSPDLESYFGAMMSQRKIEPKECFDAMKGRLEFLQACSRKPQSRAVKALLKNFVFEIDVKIPITMGPGKLLPTEEDIKIASEFRIQVGQVLESIGLRVSSARPESFLRFMGSLLNWGEDAAWRIDRPLWDPSQEIRHQVKDRNISAEVSKTSLKIGDKYICGMSPRKLPQDHHLFVMDRLVGDQISGRGMHGNFALSLIVYYPPPVETKQSIEAKTAAMKYQAYGPLLKWFPQIGERVKSFEILNHALSKGEQPVMICPAVFLFEDSQEQLKASISYTKSYYREWGWIVQEDQFIQLPMLLNHLPFGADKTGMKFLGRYGTVASKHAVEFSPVASDWKGTGNPMMSLVSRNGQLMSFDLYDSNGSFNAIIAAQSGSGKSFAVNDALVSYLSVGGRAWMIDIGKSYINLCKELGGEVIEFSEDCGIVMNPFSDIVDFEEEAETLKGILISMAQENTMLTDPQLAGLSLAMREVWEAKKNEAQVDDIANNLLASSDERLQDVGKQMFAFTKDGPYGKFFSGTSNVNFMSHFTVLELEELKARPALQRVVLMSLISKVQHAMYLTGTKQKKLLVVDEAWSLLDHPSVGPFLVGGYRKFRKVSASAIICTQSIDDLYQTPSGQAIAANSPFKLLLGQTPETVEGLKTSKRLSIGEWGFEMLRQVHTLKGEYSEIFLHTPVGMGVGRLIVSPYSRILYSTDPADRNALSAKVAQGMTMPEAINAVVKERGWIVT